ncbi:hypothetical protein E2320_013822 [Naja naja]|nr:hypothetical protein E2320_013822 [Naja naja]
MAGSDWDRRVLPVCVGAVLATALVAEVLVVLLRFRPPGEPFPFWPIASLLFLLTSALENARRFIMASPSTRGVMLAGAGQGWDHCFTCNVCVLRRDHHCLLLGQCLGYQNYRYFLCLLLYGSVALLYSSLLNAHVVWMLLEEGGLAYTVLLLLLPWLMFLMACWPCADRPPKNGSKEIAGTTWVGKTTFDKSWETGGCWPSSRLSSLPLCQEMESLSKLALRKQKFPTEHVATKGLFHVVVGTMLNPHRQSVLTNACIKPSVDPITRTPGTIYEPKGQVRLLGLLSENTPSQQEQTDEPPPPENPKISPRQGSFPFHWMWESFSIKGQTICQDQVLDKAKKLILPRAATAPARETRYNPDTILGSPAPKESHCLGVPKSSRTPEVPCSKPQRAARLAEKQLSLEELEEKLRAEMLCLATEPEEPGPQKEKRKSKNRGPNPKEELTFKPVINQKVPNFKHLQKRFQEQLEQKKEQDDEKKDQEDLFQNLRRLWSLHWRAQSCPDFEPLLLMEWERREQQEKHRAELRRLKAQHMQREVAKCLATYRNKGYSSASVQRRREELRRQEKQRMEEYMIQLQEIQDRVESRPYLFERVMQTNARQAVERRFSKVLAALGIDEEMLWKHAARQYQSTESLEEIQNLI